jgi:hypothetical protein
MTNENSSDFPLARHSQERHSQELKSNCLHDRARINNQERIPPTDSRHRWSGPISLSWTLRHSSIKTAVYNGLKQDLAQCEKILACSSKIGKSRIGRHNCPVRRRLDAIPSERQEPKEGGTGFLSQVNHGHFYVLWLP